VSSPEWLLDQYAEAFRAGKTDPRPFLEQAPDEQRDELSWMIELFLVHAEPAEWDPVAYENSLAERITERILPELLVSERGWREMLPGLRMRLEMKRGYVEDRLAAALEAKDPDERRKVADYYHDMEYGNLKPQGVSQRVLGSLAEIYGTTAEALRRAGEKTEPSGGPGAVVFARGVSDAEETFDVASPGEVVFSRISGKPDRIDRLFTDPDYDDPDR